MLKLLAVQISSYGCTWEVWGALKKLELLSAAPRATLTNFSCSPNFSRASITQYAHAKHEQILIFFRGYPQRSTVFCFTAYYLLRFPNANSVMFDLPLLTWKYCSTAAFVLNRIAFRTFQTTPRNLSIVNQLTALLHARNSDVSL